MSIIKAKKNKQNAMKDVEKAVFAKKEQMFIITR